MEKIKIREGRHYPFLGQIRPLRLFRSGMVSNYLVAFKIDDLYQLGGTDQLDINKIWGLSFGFHHNNSVRFGWRWNDTTNINEVFLYYYQDGERKSIKIGDCHLGKPFYAQMWVTMTYNKICVSVEAFDFNTTIEFRMRGVAVLGYELGAYFGGNRVAPNDISIWRDIFKTK